MTARPSPHTELLDMEAARIYRAIFGGDVPAVVKQHFVNASPRLNERFEQSELDSYYHTVERIGDLEALEVAARYVRRIPLLHSKFHMMVYLAETVPENQHHFVNERSNIAAGWWALVSGGARTAIKLVKGLFLLSRLKRA